MKNLLTTKDVAKALQVSVRTVQRYQNEPPPGFPRPVKIGRSVRYDADDLQNYINQSKG